MSKRRSSSSKGSKQAAKKARAATEKPFDRFPSHWLGRGAAEYTAQAMPMDATFDPAASAASIHSTLFWQRHLDQPCVLRADAIGDGYSDDYRAFCDLHFAAGDELGSDTEEELLAVPGRSHRSTTRTQLDPSMQDKGPEVTLGEYVENSAGSIWLSNLFSTRDDDETAFLAPLLDFDAVPDFLMRHNVLRAMKGETCADDSSDTFSQLIVGDAKTYTGGHHDTFSTGTVIHLIRGRKLWMFARPEQEAGCMAQWPSGGTINWTGLGQLPALKALVDNLQIGFIDQRAGDTIVMPPMWWHAVYNVEASISCNWPFLPAVRLGGCIADAVDIGPTSAIDCHTLFASLVVHHEHMRMSAEEAQKWHAQYIAEMEKGLEGDDKAAMVAAAKKRLKDMQEEYGVVEE